MTLKIRGTFLIGSTVALMLMTGCASLLVRSDGGIPGTVYPATSFDGAFIWQAGVKGEAIMVAAPAIDPESPNSPESTPRTGLIGSLLIVLGGIIDLPFSLITDTVLFPFDLLRPEEQEKQN